MNSKIHPFITTLLLCLSLFSYGQQPKYNTSDWTIERFKFESAILAENKVNLKTEREVMVWLPPSYSKSNKSYPVIHYLHNANWSNRQLAEHDRIQDTFSRALKRGLIQEFIFVAGDFTTTYGSGTFFGNNAVGGRWEDHIVEELVPEIDRRYRTLAKSESRVISGDFFGGYGALRIAMHHPNIFSSVYASHPVGTGYGKRIISPFPNWELLNTAKSYDDLENASGYDHAFLMMAQAFMPNLSKPPFYVDWIIDIKNGKRVANPKQITRLRNNFAFIRYMMSNIDKLRQLKAIGFDWGRHDPNFAHVEGNRDFAQALHDLGIAHQAEEFNGDMWAGKWIPYGRVENDMLPFFQRYLAFE
ncbi:alpha/beta hydrolase [Agarilytica rhodophyticola]|uniref:alpha/beta hydrolase n=1 Tax=Agarilytica rhodophyticola TaxID=1737490 RepID=UPI000B3448E5|nr:alpha/beta hydrolase-fold protein [Agarilytica rhodophyticola]